jgi:poly-beta-hydroxybutyrate-responsive repressor
MRRDRVERLGVLIGDERGPRLAAEQKIEARPGNWLTPVALVLLREESSYGYELMERLEEFGFEQITAGTLYRAHRRMEQEGLCKSEWETPEGGPARRTYSITEAGESYLAAWRRRVSSTRMLWTVSTEPIN